MKHTIIGFGYLLLMGLCWEVGAFSEEDLEKLKATSECNMCDLSKADLYGAELHYKSLVEADLTMANLTDAHLHDANLKGADLTRANLKDANLISANLKGANLTGTIFCRTIMPDSSRNDEGC